MYYEKIYLSYRILWAIAGVILGIYALIRVRNRTMPIVKGMWWFQILATPLSVLFVIWTITAFHGLVVQLPWQAVLPLSAASVLALPNAFWLLVYKEDAALTE